MKTVKPLRLGVMTSVFEVRRAPHLCVSLLAGFSLEEQPSLVPEAALWLSVTKELGPNVPLDVCRPKPNGEVLLSGKAYPPGGPAPVCSVRLRLGPIDKRLAVLGDRTWKLGVPTEPAPFSEMPLTWSRAFGGKGFAKNPVGRGFAPEKSGAGEAHFLPNVEDLRQLVKAPGDRPEPATFGPADLTLPERWARSGTYDERWLRTEAPGLPSDFDWSFFNVAAPDQRIDGFFSGGEPIELENVHPERPRIVSAVPAIAGRAFITRRTPGGEEWAEVPLRMETLHLLPGALLGVAIFRGVSRVAEDDARDVLHLLAALDDANQPRSAEYYRDVLARRLDKEKGHLHALRDRELLPAGASYAAFRADEVGIPGAQTERLVHKNLRAGAEARLAAIEEELEQFPESKRNANVPKALPPEPPIPDVDEMADRVEELEKEMARARELVKRQTEEAIAKARASCEAAGLDWEEQQRKAKEGAAGPPRFSADEKLAELRALAERCRNEGTPHAQLEAHLADPEFERKLRWSEDKLRDMYQRHAHHFPPAAPLSGDALERTRVLVKEARAAGGSLAGRDLTGAVLDGLDLSGMDLEGAMLEAASLRGAWLRGARLGRAVLARADLEGADLEGAELDEANLGQATLLGAKLGRARLGRATLDKARLSGADLTSADLSGATLDAAEVGDAVFRDAKLAGVRFLDARLAEVDFTEADLTGATFLQCDLAGARLAGAKLVSAVFLRCNGKGARLDRAALDNARFVEETNFSGASFRGATMVEANLRGTELVASDLTEVTLDRGDLSECDLRGARLDRIRARESRWVRARLDGATLRGADLMLALLQKASVAGADFRGASLFRADLVRMKGDERTSFDGANVTQVRFLEAEP
ncbi:DUF2169 domain-containing protein [Sorangium sp. So ce385]|uniref:DUF2169 family type VI secretion system accessory protein n=1 Tax=Sorangium sp. So ce385 TaxID=3133308 RepID=UPI003F5BFD18